MGRSTAPDIRGRNPKPQAQGPKEAPQGPAVFGARMGRPSIQAGRCPRTIEATPIGLSLAGTCRPPEPRREKSPEQVGHGPPVGTPDPRLTHRPCEVSCRQTSPLKEDRPGSRWTVHAIAVPALERPRPTTNSNPPRDNQAALHPSRAPAKPTTVLQPRRRLPSRRLTHQPKSPRPPARRRPA